MKKLFALLLCCALVCSLTAAAFAEPRHMSNFENTRPYYAQFKDVPKNAWYADVVRTCYEYQLMDGVSKTEFAPQAHLTVAQALALAVRIRSIYETETPLAAGKGKNWYQPYVDYALTNGWINEWDFNDFGRPISRAETAYLFADALPPAELHSINTVTSIPDVKGGKYRNSVLFLYNAGVLTGSGPERLFHPEDSLQRSEAAAIISRMIKPSLRQKFTMLQRFDLSDIAPGLTVYMTGLRDETEPEHTAKITDASGRYHCIAVNAGAPGQGNIKKVPKDTMMKHLEPTLAENGFAAALTLEKCRFAAFGSVPAYRYEFSARDSAGKAYLGFAFNYYHSDSDIRLFFLAEKDSSEFRQVIAAPALNGKTVKL